MSSLDHGSLAGLDDNDHGAIYYTETEIDAKLGLVGDIQCIMTRMADGTTSSSWTSTPMSAMPAADTNCEISFNGHMPANMTAMTNPNLIISYSGAAADTWTLDVRVNAAGDGDAQGNNLHNGAESLSVGAGAQFALKTVALSGTISPSDNIGVRLEKTSNDAQILYITNVCWIQR